MIAISLDMGSRWTDLFPREIGSTACPKAQRKLGSGRYRAAPGIEKHNEPARTGNDGGMSMKPLDCSCVLPKPPLYSDRHGSAGPRSARFWANLFPRDIGCMSRFQTHLEALVQGRSCGWPASGSLPFPSVRAPRGDLFPSYNPTRQSPTSGFVITRATSRRRPCALAKLARTTGGCDSS
jgi:hypothetical protein